MSKDKPSQGDKCLNCGDALVAYVGDDAFLHQRVDCIRNLRRQLHASQQAGAQAKEENKLVAVYAAALGDARDQISSLEKRWNDMRGERDALEDDIGEWKEASGLIVGGDPAGVTPSMLEMSRQKDDAENERLRVALKDMMLAVQSFHGEPGWELYKKDAPEWQGAKAALGEDAELARQGGAAKKDEEKPDGQVS